MFKELSQKSILTDMEYYPFQQQAPAHFDLLHAQECKHMNEIVFLLRPDLKKGREKKKKKKKDRPTNPPNFQAKRANKPFIFF